MNSQRISMFLGKWLTSSHGTLDPRALYQENQGGRALTGSESSFFHVAKSLSERGHEVHAFCDVAAPLPDLVNLGGVSVFPIDTPIDDYDAHIVLGEPYLFRELPKNRFKICWQQNGDFPVENSDFDGYIDRYVALSPGHLDHIMGPNALVQKLPKLSKWSWIPNPIDLDMWKEAGPEPRDKFRMAWCSSADRGLHRLLEIFPDIKRRVPEAALDIYYLFDAWYERVKESPDANGDRARYIHECLTRFGRNGENGVVLHGPIGNLDLIKRLQKTRILPYTCDTMRFTETFSVAIMDACASGCLPIISDVDALPSVYEGIAKIIPGRPGDARELWIDEICSALTSDEPGTQAEKAREFAEAFDRKRVVRLWEKLLEGGKDQNGQEGFPKSIRDYVKATNDAEPLSVVTSPASVIEVDRNKPLRLCVILGRTGSAIHGVLNPDTVFEEEGAFATGTVAGFFNIAGGLAARGHTVDAFCECERPFTHSKHGGAHFYPLDEKNIDVTYDAYISINEPDMLRTLPKEKIRITALWLNDFSFCQPGWDDVVDYYCSPSETHLKLIERQGIARKKLDVIPLGVNLDFHDLTAVKRPGSIAYCSSPDRGLHHLLEMFPDIRKRVPEAHLRIYYRFWPWYHMMTADPKQNGSHTKGRAAEIGELLKKLGDNGQNGVTLVGPISQRAMARELGETMVFAYPCDPIVFTEGFGMAIMDACAAGCVPIVSAVDAVPEIYKGAAFLIDGNPFLQRQKWIDTICRSMEDRELALEARILARLRAQEFSREKLAVRWESFIRNKLETQ